MAMLPAPSNPSELQLYRVLQRANLLQYYHTFIAQGGDDVSQLCEAGEDEFLEIMALVGMASKPLHVRRLQKALQEWVTNPNLFRAKAAIVTKPPTDSIAGALNKAGIIYKPAQPAAIVSVPTSNSSSSSLVKESLSVGVISALGKQTDFSEKSQPNNISPVSTNLVRPLEDEVKCLTREQILMISEAADKLTKALPPLSPKPASSKKIISKEIEELMAMPLEQHGRMELMRKYGAIYGRFDSKRRQEKAMSLHELCVNEAAAQLCARIPILLTRREDLFPLARQIVRESGYPFAKGHSRSQDNEGNPIKRFRLDGTEESIMEQLQSINVELKFTEAQIKEIRTKAKEYPDHMSSDFTERIKVIEAHAGKLIVAKSTAERKLTDLYKSSYTAAVSVETTKQLVKETLFDEGLRIAQQYGMEGLVNELSGLKENEVKQEIKSVHENNASPSTMSVPEDSRSSPSSSEGNKSYNNLSICKQEVIFENGAQDEDSYKNENGVVDNQLKQHHYDEKANNSFSQNFSSQSLQTHNESIESQSEVKFQKTDTVEQKDMAVLVKCSSDITQEKKGDETSGGNEVTSIGGGLLLQAERRPLQLQTDEPLQQKAEASSQPQDTGVLHPQGNGGLHPQGNGGLHPQGNGALHPQANRTLQPQANGTLQPQANGTLQPQAEETTHLQVEGTSHLHVQGTSLEETDGMTPQQSEMSTHKSAHFDNSDDCFDQQMTDLSKSLNDDEQAFPLLGESWTSQSNQLSDDSFQCRRSGRKPKRICRE